MAEGDLSIKDLLEQVALLGAQVEGLHAAFQVVCAQRDGAQAELMDLKIEVERLRWLAKLSADGD